MIAINVICIAEIPITAIESYRSTYENARSN